MQRKLSITVVVALLVCGACASFPFKKSGPETSFIVFSSETIGELKPCG